MNAQTILVADADVPFLQALAVRFRSEQHEVILAQDADQAADRGRQGAPDLLILNVDLRTRDGSPGREGVEAVVDTDTVPLIYLADQPALAHEELARRSGAFALLVKPFEPDELLGRVRAALAARAKMATRRSA